MSMKPGRVARLISAEPMRRVLGRSGQGGSPSPGVKVTAFFVALLLLTALLAWLDPRPSLRHVQVSILSGSTSGNYFATVDRLAAEVARRKGHVRNVSSTGSVENVQRLIEAGVDCAVQFGLVQDGVVFPEGHGLELLGRLPRPESLIVLGRNVNAIRVPEDLKGLRIGIGPVGSGTEQLMRHLLLPLVSLEVQVSAHSFDEQIGRVERGELDLAAMVIDEGAALLSDAVIKHKLEILQLPDVASLARRLPFARVGVIEAGQIDYVRRLPRQETQVLQVDTLILGNGCASNGVTQGLLTAVVAMAPTFVRHNRDQANLTGLPMATVAENFFDDGGPDLLGRYAPWAVDIMPLPTWLHLGVALSVLFSGMAFAHRFRLWRIDANRLQIERAISALLGPDTTVGSLGEMTPDPSRFGPEARAQIDELLAGLAGLAERCRKQSVSVLVPMGEEMSYRYQEALIGDLLNALRLFKSRLLSN
jgi:uncharacterized protein